MKKLFLIPVAAFALLTSCECDEPIGPKDRCDLKPNAGPCEAAIIRYYYDSDAGECKQFYYGGCDGTVPFETLEDCKESCLYDEEGAQGT